MAREAYRRSLAFRFIADARSAVRTLVAIRTAHPHIRVKRAARIDAHDEHVISRRDECIATIGTAASCEDGARDGTLEVELSSIARCRRLIVRLHKVNAKAAEELVRSHLANDKLLRLTLSSIALADFAR